MEKAPRMRTDAERNVLVEKHLRLPNWVIFQTSAEVRMAAKIIGFDDARQMAIVTLLRASELWSEERGAFSTYATTSIRNILVRHASRIKQRRRLTALSIDECEEEDFCNCVNADRLYEAASTFNVQRDLLPNLTRRQQQFARLWLGLDDGFEPLCPADAGKIMGITRQRSCQLKDEIVKKAYMAIEFK